MAFHPTGIPLGTLWEKHWTRNEIDTDSMPAEKRKRLKQTPIEDKESIRWIEGLRVDRDVAEESPNTQCILVCDSEADIHEFFAEPRHTSHGRSLDILVRGCHSRATTTKGGTILDAVRATPCRYTATIQVKAHTPTTPTETRKRKTKRTARMVQVEVRLCSVTLPSPRRIDRQLPPVAVNVILVEEMSPPPPGEDPIQWILLTTLPIETDEQIRAGVDYCCGRWGIESFYRHFKQTYDRRKLRSASAPHAHLEMQWSLLGLWAMALYVQVELQKQKLDTHMLSIAKVLKAFRRMHRDYLHPMDTNCSLNQLLQRAVRDPYQRRNKSSRNYPRKKRPDPPARRTSPRHQHPKPNAPSGLSKPSKKG